MTCSGRERQPRRPVAGRARHVATGITLALSALLASVPAEAATWEQVVQGTIRLSGSETPEDEVYHANGCATDVKDGIFAATIGVRQYGGKTLEIRFQSAAVAFGPPGLLMYRATECTPLHTGGSLQSDRVNPKFKFKVTDEDHVYLLFTGTASDVSYSIWRCTSTTC